MAHSVAARCRVDAAMNASLRRVVPGATSMSTPDKVRPRQLTYTNFCVSDGAMLLLCNARRSSLRRASGPDQKRIWRKAPAKVFALMARFFFWRRAMRPFLPHAAPRVAT